MTEHSSALESACVACNVGLAQGAERSHSKESGLCIVRLRAAASVFSAPCVVFELKLVLIRVA